MFPQPMAVFELDKLNKSTLFLLGKQNADFRASLLVQQQRFFCCLLNFVHLETEMIFLSNLFEVISGVRKSKTNRITAQSCKFFLWCT